MTFDPPNPVDWARRGMGWGCCCCGEEEEEKEREFPKEVPVESGGRVEE